MVLKFLKFIVVNTINIIVRYIENYIIKYIFEQYNHHQSSGLGALKIIKISKKSNFNNNTLNLKKKTKTYKYLF